jgi:soluble lytic murein transglycosylase-like protein
VQKNTWFYRFIVATISINMVMICMLTFWAIDNRQTLQVVQVEVQELKRRIEMEIKLRQELLPQIKKSAELLSRYNPGLDPMTALSYAIKIWQCSDEVVTNDLLTALIVIESGADHTAKSPQGALGLTQIMPGHWPYDTHELRDPYKNIEAGAAILRQYIQRHGLIGGLRAYNCGTSSNPPGDASMKYAKKILQTAETHF